MRKRITYANVMATVAVFLALGGTSYAVTKLPKNSVGTAQLKADAVTSLKIKNGSLVAKDFGRNQIPKGPIGPAGPAGPVGAAGPAGPITGALPTGVTLRGRYVARFTSRGIGDIGGTGIAFGFSLSAKPTPHFIQQGTTAPAECPGTPADPKAAPGHLCVFEGGFSNRTLPVISDVTAAAGTEVYGAGIAFASDIAGTVASVSSGSWAVTAP